MAFEHPSNAEHLQGFQRFSQATRMEQRERGEGSGNTRLDRVQTLQVSILRAKIVLLSLQTRLLDLSQLISTCRDRIIVPGKVFGTREFSGYSIIKRGILFALVDQFKYRGGRCTPNPRNEHNCQDLLDLLSNGLDNPCRVC